MERTKGRRDRHRKEYMTKAAVPLTIPPLLLCAKNKLKIRSRPLWEPGSDCHNSVREMGLEPTRAFTHKILSLACLPIPALPLNNLNYLSINMYFCKVLFSFLS